MERKYSLALKAGIKYGLILTVIYVLFTLVGVWLSTTPAMVSYTNQLNEHNKEIFNQTYGSTNYSYPYTYQYSLPRPPLEFYLSMMISLFVLAILAVGLIATGALVIKNGEQATYSMKDVLYMSVLACAGVFVPLVIGYAIVWVISLFVNSSTLATSFGALGAIPGMSTIVPVMVVVELACCCLPAIAVIAVILTCIGAFGYAVFAHRLESRTAPAQP